jgi:hypothetical protein
MLKTIVHDALIREAAARANGHFAPVARATVTFFPATRNRGGRELKTRIKFDMLVRAPGYEALSLSATLRSLEGCHKRLAEVARANQFEVPRLPSVSLHCIHLFLNEHAAIESEVRETRRAIELLRQDLELYFGKVARHPLLWAPLADALHFSQWRPQQQGDAEQRQVPPQQQQQQPPSRLPTIPPLVANLFPGLSPEGYTRLQKDVSFLQRTVEVCQQCARELFSFHAGSVCHAPAAPQPRPTSSFRSRTTRSGTPAPAHSPPRPQTAAALRRPQSRAREEQQQPRTRPTTALHRPAPALAPASALAPAPNPVREAECRQRLQLALDALARDPDGSLSEQQWQGETSAPLLSLFVSHR